MPIKFRCIHCQQFLGIGRGKAGEVVDCPTCGRAVRVPSEGGESGPVPDPKLDSEDPHLAGVLDELALISELPPTSQTDAVALPPLPREDVDIEPEVPDAISLSEGQQLDAIAELATMAGSSSGPLSLKTSSLPARRSARNFRFRIVQISLIFSIAASVFALVYSYTLTSRLTSEDVAPVGARPAEPAERKSLWTATPNTDAAAGVSLPGRITYLDDLGAVRPDRGACVIAFPSTRPGVAKLSIIGFRPGDSPADFKLARAGLRVLGGGVAVVKEEGSFDLSLAEPGTFQLLVLSHYRKREGDQRPDANHQRLLERYFDRPQQLLGQLAFHFAEVHLDQSTAGRWDYSFAASK